MYDKVTTILKTGDEPLVYNNTSLKFSLLDFWRWSVSDILSNATRGILAEFIVATATNVNIKTCREEWSAFDLETTEGIKVEVKSAAYLQSWFQKELSPISFSTRAAIHWDSATGKYGDVAKRHADVYVFCLLKHKDKRTVDPLNLNQWEFYVLSTKQLNDHTKSLNSISLNALQKLTKPVTYENIYEEVKMNYIKFDSSP